MSSIAVTASATGAGVITLAAPVTNTNRTITLPDVTATVITDSAGVLNIGAGQLYKDAIGNVGIGTSAPSSKLEVAGTLNAVALGTTLAYGVSGEVYSAFRFNNSSFAGGNSEIRNIVNGSASTGSALSFLTTQTGSGPLTERARIDSSGNLLVGTTTNPYGSKVVASGGFTSTNSTQFNIAGTAATNFEFVLRTGSGMQFYVNNATVIGTLTASGVWTNASDARYKENIRPVSYGLAEVMQLLPREYNIIGSEKQEIGFVAQEIEPLIPELVESTTNSVTGEDRLSLSYGQLSAVLVKAIQELKAIVDAQGAEIASLKGASA